MSVVWAVQNTVRIVDGRLEPVHDLSLASRFGRVEEMVPGDLGSWKHRMGSAHIRAAAARYDPEGDLLLMVGGQIFVAIAFAMFLDRAWAVGVPAVRTLAWSRRAKDYWIDEVAVADCILPEEESR